MTSARASRLAALARRLRLPAVVGLGIKDAFAQRARSLLTLGSLAMAAVLVVCALGFEATMDRLAGDPALRARPWDISLSPAGVPAREMERLIAAAGGPSVRAVARVGELPLIAPAAAAEVRARVVDGPLAPFRFAVPEGRGVDGPGEVTAGRGLLEALGARVGDRIELSVRGMPFSARIVGRHVEPDAGGRAVVLTPATLPPATRALLHDPAWVLRLRDGADEAAVADALARAGGGRIGVGRPRVSLQREAGELRPIVYGVTGLVVAIGLVNLLTTLLLGLRERERDLAVLGTIGATPRQVAGTVLAGGAALAVPGALLGVPAGAWLLGFLVARTDPSDGPDVVVVPSPLLLALALPAGLLVTAAVSALARHGAPPSLAPARALPAECHTAVTGRRRACVTVRGTCDAPSSTSTCCPASTTGRPTWPAPSSSRGWPSPTAPASSRSRRTSATCSRPMRSPRLPGARARGAGGAAARARRARGAGRRGAGP